MSDLSEAADLLQAHLAMPTSSFSIGSFGAIGEFHRDPGEALTLDDPAGLRLSTARGAIAISIDPDVRPVAYESLSGRAGRWQQGVVFCLPRTEESNGGRRTLTELGPDREAVHAQDRDAVLFDLGLRAANMEFCVRTADPDLLAVLRADAGRDLLAGPSESMEAIKDRGPHRVARSRLGRIEIYQRIDRKKTPEGPHTHVLPKLIGEGRTHSANTPVPEGQLPCLSLYPANPLSDAMGEPKPFDAVEHATFQEILERWGPADYLDAKARTIRALENGDAPGDCAAPDSRLGRTAVRVALRQRTSTHCSDPRLAVWCEAFDRAPVTE